MTARYDASFRAGYTAGKRARSGTRARSAYKRVSKKHGSDWIDGFLAARDVKAGAYATSAARRAKRLGLC